MPRSLAMAIQCLSEDGFTTERGPSSSSVSDSSSMSFRSTSFHACRSTWVLDIFLPQFLQGLGFGLIFVSLSTAVLSTIKTSLMTAASGSTRRAAGLRQHRHRRGRHSSDPGRAIEQGSPHGARDPLQRRHLSIAQQSLLFLSFARRRPYNSWVRGLETSGGNGDKHASMLSYNHVFFLIALLFFMSLPLLLLVKDPQRASSARLVAE